MRVGLVRNQVRRARDREKRLDDLIGRQGITQWPRSKNLHRITSAHGHVSRPR